MKIAQTAAERLEKDRKSVCSDSDHTVKPLDRADSSEILHNHMQVVVIEACVPRGRLAGQIKEIAWDQHADCKLLTFTLQDEFIHKYGSHNELLSAHGLDGGMIYRAICS